LKNLCAQAPDFVPVLRERAKDLTARDDKKRALRLLDKAVRTTPSAALLDELEAISSDDPARLAKLYAKLVSSHPDDAALRARAAKHLIANDNAEEAADLLSADESGGYGAITHELWGEIHEARADTGKAAVEYRNAIRIRGDGPSLYVCGICNSTAVQWDARCGHCSAWGSLDAAGV
jgi:predicted negative regulator of RcsB-dependent stress response